MAKKRQASDNWSIPSFQGKWPLRIKNRLQKIMPYQATIENQINFIKILKKIHYIIALW